MEFLKKPRTWVIAGVAIGSIFLLYQLWHWEVERVEVGPGQFLVKINLWGKNLPEGEIPRGVTSSIPSSRRTRSTTSSTSRRGSASC
jgi:hypothetical protein